eukprot:NODE_1_length_95616_cov_0.657642.p56 type:complete len:190 gc:universal NODE_1_length_95616_cov_0.657642:75976-75407(-)
MKPCLRAVFAQINYSTYSPLKQYYYMSALWDRLLTTPTIRISFTREGMISEQKLSNHSTYSTPENYLEIRVKNPLSENPENPSNLYTTYEVHLKTNLPLFKIKESIVRRRYKDCEIFKSYLERECPHVHLPNLPGKVLRNRFSDEVIDTRMKGLERFLQIVAGHPLVQTSSKILIPFLQDPVFHRDNWK